MTKRIKTPEEYKNTFNDPVKRKRAFQCALDIRKFEIELYWKRAAYFWTLIAATFAGYFALAANDGKNPRLLLLVSCIGLVISTGWYLVNRGSKYWQKNWERHVDSLEDEFVGPLYKTTISKRKIDFLCFWRGYPYSVSKVNQLVSLFVVFVWLGVAGVTLLGHTLPAYITEAGPWLIAGGTIIFVGMLFCLGLGGSQRDPRSVDFHISELVPAKDDSGAWWRPASWRRKK